MQLLITRPVVITGPAGTRSFAPSLTVEVDAATAQQAGIPVEPAVAPAQTPAQTEIPAAPSRRRRPADAAA